jgi:cytochrome bd ubiquinol oxidase subunit I
VQPLKIAATEALWDAAQPAAFSLIQIGCFTVDEQTPTFEIAIPGLLSFLSTNSFRGEVVGIDPLQAQDAQAARTE